MKIALCYVCGARHVTQKGLGGRTGLGTVVALRLHRRNSRADLVVDYKRTAVLPVPHGLQS
jgi:hypothetical protein